MNPMLCALCDDVIHEPEDAFCWGCGTHICESCDINSPTGPHSPTDHFNDPSDEDEEEA